MAGSIGGPIFKDKLFFFGDYQGTSDHETVSNTLTIPDARYYTANAQGNIDLSAAVTGGAGQIFDPATGDGNGTGPGHQRTAFANNQIPFNRVNPVSLDILKGINSAARTTAHSTRTRRWGIRPTITPPIFRLQRLRIAGIRRSTGRSTNGTTSAAGIAGRELPPSRLPLLVRFLVDRLAAAFKARSSDVVQHGRELRPRLFPDAVHGGTSWCGSPAE